MLDLLEALIDQVEEAQEAYICQTKKEPSRLKVVDPVHGLAECEACGHEVVLHDFNKLKFSE